MTVIRVVQLMSILLAWTTPGSAQEAGPKEKAYVLTLTCSVVASWFKDEAMYAKTSDAISKTGQVLGYSREKQARDIVSISSALGNEQRSNPTIMDRHRSACRRYGLAS